MCIWHLLQLNHSSLMIKKTGKSKTQLDVPTNGTFFLMDIFEINHSLDLIKTFKKGMLDPVTAVKVAALVNGLHV